jgi:hypothetical protein
MKGSSFREKTWLVLVWFEHVSRAWLLLKSDGKWCISVTGVDWATLSISFLIEMGWTGRVDRAEMEGVQLLEPLLLSARHSMCENRQDWSTISTDYTSIIFGREI